jgi:hypothetical protein
MSNREILFYFGLMILFVASVIYFANAMIAKEMIKQGHNLSDIQKQIQEAAKEKLLKKN